MPSVSSLEAIQQAVAAVLVADSTLVALVGGVENILNYEPEEPPSEFVIVGNAIEESWNTLGGTGRGWGWEVLLTVHIYSYYKGDINALQILGRLTTLLNFQPLTVTGYGTVICEYGARATKVMVETKDKQERRHIPAVFTIRVHE